MKIDIIPFNKALHGNSRKDFDCGVEELNDYLKKQASQDIRRHTTSLFVAIEPETNRILGYYTLSPSAVDKKSISEGRYEIPIRYSKIPSILLGRLAVDKTMQGQGLGVVIMANAILRCLDNNLEWAIMTVDAKDYKACSFYKKFKFAPLADDPNHLFVKREELEDFIKHEKKRLAQNKDEIKEVRLLISGGLLKNCETAAKSKGLSLQDYFINLAKKDIETLNA